MESRDSRVVVVTGGARGVGLAVARLFATEGATVVVNDLGTEIDGSGQDASVAEHAAAELRALGATALASSDDVATPQGAEALVEQTVSRFGRLDTLVCCAGFLRDGLLGRLDDAAFDAVYRVHVKGTLYPIRAASERMKRTGGGRIVTTTSLAAFQGNYGQSSYAAATAAVYGLSRTASIELQRHGITVNCVAPIAKTRLTEALPMFEHVDTMTAEHVAPAYLFFGTDRSGDASGNVLAVAGARISIYRMSESSGRLKEGDGDDVWTADEIRQHWELLSKDRH